MCGWMRLVYDSACTFIPSTSTKMYKDVLKLGTGSQVVIAVSQIWDLAFTAFLLLYLPCRLTQINFSWASLQLPAEWGGCLPLQMAAASPNPWSSKET